MTGVVVVGGGVGGLVAAHDLARAGASVTVLERSDRFGGQLEAVELAGRTVDLGAESFATRDGVVAALLADLDLTGEVVAPLDRPAWVHDAASGRAYPLPAAGVLGIPVHPRLALRALGVLGVARAACDAVLPRTGVPPGASVGDVVARRMGARVRDRLVDPVVRGVYSTAAADLALTTASPALARELAAGRTLAGAAARVRAASPAGSQVAGLRGGTTVLVRALVAAIAAHGGVLRTGVEVTGVDADGVSTRRADGAAEHVAADHVVVAVPGLLSRATTERRITVVAAAVRAPGLDAHPRGTGVLVARSGLRDGASAGADDVGGVGARALTHSSAKWSWLAPRDGVHLVRLSYDAGPADGDDGTPTRAQVTHDVRVLTGVRDAVVGETATRTWTRTIAVDLLPTTGATTVPATLVGEAAGRTGLAAVVAHARSGVATLLTRPTTQGAPS
ncbi:protoporphyrinogen/coproporphyrinogen oxidase [Serinibacter arcticus]|uniref:Protoporphyrinogen IX oxidase, aerobic, HemY n=1 Tax=Serinibacter arcticus TaxID=1655435 RepID=A0A4Z1E0N6_9MICO|nr:FAD-dependent oxidoreductase [Serinibacter arcticus]TGO04638.1 Protoporphyrinogen IX oxidase, aerobic, HemY [Serinibacter arcticus]